jgi:hypothetical protein
MAYSKGKVGQGKGWVETNPSNIHKHLYLTSAKAVSLVPCGEVTDVRRENTDVRLVGFHPLLGKARILRNLLCF